MAKVYEDFHTGELIHEDDAFEYALEHVKKDRQLKLEFTDWYFSGGHIEHSMTKDEAEKLMIYGEKPKVAI